MARSPPVCKGELQIIVTFDINGNGILNVSAVDKSTRKQSKITITNDNGCLSAEEIQKVVSEVEKYQDEDDKHRNCISAKNFLESYTFNTKSTMKDKVKDKVSEQEYKNIINN